MKFVPMKVVKLVRETADATTLIFEKPFGFDYLPGQYLTLRFVLGGEEFRRAYSLCSSPVKDPHLAVTVKRVSGGKVSNYIHDTVKEGDSLEVMPPMGNFKIHLQGSQARHIALVGGGSGITPLMSILRSTLEVENRSFVTLVFANQNQDSIIFKASLADLEQKFPDKLRVIHVLEDAPDTWTGLRGRLNKDSLLPLFQSLLSSDNLPKEFFLCGPVGLMEEAQAALSFAGVPKEKVHREVFTATLPLGEEKKAPSQYSPKRGAYSVTVILDQVSKTVQVPADGTILSAAKKEGMDPPYACQMGVCCTCRAKLISGEVEMDTNEGLSDQEIEEGFILTCQSHPLTPDVTVEFG